jgi:hypothetical protein
MASLQGRGIVPGQARISAWRRQAGPLPSRHRAQWRRDTARPLPIGKTRSRNGKSLGEIKAHS